MALELSHDEVYTPEEVRDDLGQSTLAVLPYLAGANAWDDHAARVMSVDANPKDSGLRLDLAQLLAQLGKPEQAKPIVAEVAKDEPTNALALQTLFRVSAASNDYVTAKSAADGIVATQPKLPVGYMYQGMIAEHDKQHDQRRQP